jgi:cytochrome c-type protein NapC
MEGKNPNVLGRCWSALRKPSVKYSVLTLLVVGFGAGVMFWGGFNTALEATNTLEFCTTCHEMRDTVYQEYKNSVHYKNKFGVRAICPDCHVPRDFTHKMIRKAQAAFEVWGKITGDVDTKQKFEAKRMQLATHEWARMEASNSRECRNCHNWDAMDEDAQGSTMYKRHMDAKAAGKSCIDCHKGITHHLPKEYHDPNDDEE